MSNETMQKAWDAAKAFVADTEELPGLIEAIKAHRTEEASAPAPETASDPTEPAETEPSE